MKKQIRRQKRKAFSLIEILVSVAVLAILAGAAMPAIGMFEEARKLSESSKVLSAVSEALGKTGISAVSFSFLDVGDAAFSAAFNDADRLNETRRAVTRPDFLDGFGKELRIHSTYDDSTMTGVVLVYVEGDNSYTVGGATISARKQGDIPLYAVVFQN